MGYSILRGHDLASTIRSMPSGPNGLLTALVMNAMTSCASSDYKERAEALAWFRSDVYGLLTKKLGVDKYPVAFQCSGTPFENPEVERVFVRCDCSQNVYIAKAGHMNICPKCHEKFDV